MKRRIKTNGETSVQLLPYWNGIRVLKNEFALSVLYSVRNLEGIKKLPNPTTKRVTKIFN